MRSPLETLRLLWGFAWLRQRRGWMISEGNNDAAALMFFGGIAMSAIFCLFMYRLATVLLAAVVMDIDPTGALPMAPEGVLALFMVLAGGIGLFAALSRANDVLFMGADLDLMMSLPLDRRGVVLGAMAETWLPWVLGSVALVLAPGLLAYAVMFRAWHALALLPLAVVALSVLAATAGVMAMILLGRVASTPRAREAMGFVGALVGAAAYILAFSTGFGADVVDVVAGGLSDLLSGPASLVAWLAAIPVSWPAVAIHFISWGPIGAGIAIAAAGTLATAMTVWVVTTASAGAYVRGLGLSGRRGRRRGSVRSRPARIRSGVMGALLTRDLAILTRTPRLWHPVVFPLAWMVFWLFGRGSGMPLPADPLIMGGVVAAMIAYVSGPLSMNALGVEGPSFYHVSTLPVSPLGRVISKILVFSLGPALLGTVMVVVLMWSSGTATDLARSLVLVVTGSVTMSALGLMSGADDARFDAERPAGWRSGRAGCLFVLLMLCIVGVAIVIIHGFRTGGQWLGVGPGVADTAAVLFIAACCLGGLTPGLARNAASIVRRRSTRCDL